MCPSCHVQKEISEFYPNRRTGKTCYRCKSCEREQHRMYYLKNSESVRAKSYKRYAEHKQENAVRCREYYSLHAEKIKERSRQWAKDNRERCRENNRRWYWGNIDTAKAIAKRTRHNNPLMVAMQNQRRRSRKKGVRRSLTINEWRFLLELCDYRCLACGTKEKLTQDHIVPLSPGEHTLHNIQPICMKCNRKKHRTIVDYRPLWMKDILIDTVGQNVFYGKVTAYTDRRLHQSSVFAARNSFSL